MSISCSSSTSRDYDVPNAQSSSFILADLPRGEGRVPSDELMDEKADSFVRDSAEAEDDLVTLASTAETVELPAPTFQSSPSQTKSSSPDCPHPREILRATTPELSEEDADFVNQLFGGPSTSFGSITAFSSDYSVDPPHTSKRAESSEKAKAKATERATERRFVDVEESDTEMAGSDHDRGRANGSHQTKRDHLDGTNMPAWPKVHDNRLVPVMFVQEGRYRCHVGSCNAEISPFEAAWDEHLKEMHYTIGLPEDTPAAHREWDPMRCTRTMALDSLGRHLATVHVCGVSWRCPVEGCGAKSTRKDACQRHVKQVHSALFEFFLSA
ncbi:hypothetical protein B0H21DRAFT_706823 [Amylocystis lapponica]|nr:hypothetical protein B0H21DRAFT_706823 [Amylocystis lapponica]